jgi:hypothetical protein
MGAEPRKCLDCGEVYEVLRDLRPRYADAPYTSLDPRARGLDDLACPACRSERFEARLSVGTGIDLGDVGGAGRVYPYFDRALNRQINSAAHRRQVCKELNVHPIEGSFMPQLERSMSRHESAIEAQQAAFREQQAREDADPDIRRAKGMFAAMTKDLKNPLELRERLRRR